MMLDPDDQQAVREHTSWNATSTPDSITNRLPVVAWYLAIQILALPIVPLLWRFLPWLPDRGYGLAKTFGLFAVGWIAWWIASARLLDFGLAAIAVAWLAIFAVGLGILWKHALPLARDLRAARAWIVATELIFLGGYLLAIAVRSRNPDLWLPDRIGSQLQDMATFNAMALTPFFPAYDPWLADGSIHDFTFGFMPWAVLTRATGILPETAFSLSLASMAALAILNAWLASAVLAKRLLGAGSPARAILGGLLAPCS